jgi:hypothetical protein
LAKSVLGKLNPIRIPETCFLKNISSPHFLFYVLAYQEASTKLCTIFLPFEVEGKLILTFIL